MWVNRWIVRVFAASWWLTILLFAVPGVAASASTRALAPLRAPRPARPLWQPPKLGERTLNAKGQLSGVVNGYVQGTREEVEQLFKAAGWNQAAPRTLKNNLKYVGAVAVQLGARAVHRRNGWADDVVQHMPVSLRTYEGAPPVVSFEKDNHAPFGGRHHFRVFDTGSVGSDGRPVWAISASRDLRVVFVPNVKTFFTDHQIEPNVDKERDLILDEAKGTKLIQSHAMVPAKMVEPSKKVYSEDNQAFFMVVKPSKR